MNIKIKPRTGARKVLPLRVVPLWACAFALLGSAGAALGQSGALRANVVPELNAFKVVSSAGGEKLVSAAKISPGEVIEYQVRYANTGAKGAKNLQAILPIPASLQFVPGSALPAGAQASLNGKTYAAMPLKRVVKAADGTPKTEVVPASEYRFLRWNVADLGAGQSVRVSARAQLAALLKAK